MNKAHSMMAAFSLVLGALVLVPSLNIAFAQYSAPAGQGGVTLEEQLQLAKEKISNAQQRGAYGSGTAMFGSNLDNSLILMIIIGVIIGGVAAAFFAAGTKGKRRTIETSHDGYSSGGGKFCTNCGTQAGDSQKFCGNCGTKI